RVCAVCSRSSNATRSWWVSCRSRDRLRRRMRASESSSSSLSRSRQLRTLLEKPRMERLLKTTRPKLPPWRTRSKHYLFALCSPLGRRSPPLFLQPPTTRAIGPPKQGTSKTHAPTSSPTIPPPHISSAADTRDISDRQVLL